MMRDLNAQAAYIAARENMPFAWGSHDCAHFAAGAIKALTGIDPLAGIAGWTSERGAMAELKRRGGLIEGVSAILDEIPIAWAHRGDIGAVESEAGPLLMVIEGMTLVGPGPTGLVRLPRTYLIATWSAGS